VGAVDLGPQDVRLEPPLLWVRGRPAIVYWKDVMIFCHQRAEIFIHLHIAGRNGCSGPWLAQRLGRECKIESIVSYIARMRSTLRSVNAHYEISHGRGAYILSRTSGC